MAVEIPSLREALSGDRLHCWSILLLIIEFIHPLCHQMVVKMRHIIGGCDDVTTCELEKLENLISNLRSSLEKLEWAKTYGLEKLDIKFSRYTCSSSRSRRTHVGQGAHV
jgi:hypothetical protein